MSEHRPVGGRLVTLPMLGLAVITAIGAYYLVQRFQHGLGAVTNLNNGYPWGIWVVYDIVVGTAFACGGYVMAFTVYVLNRGRYHPLVRPAMLASLFGYALGGFSAFFDAGRWWQIYNMFLPWHMNFNSVMLEVGLCVAAYITVLLIELAPMALERFGMENARHRLEKVLFVFIALGLVLPTMHQSSLGSLLIVLGGKVSPLWQSFELMPVLALVSVVVMGFSIVMFESSFSALGLKRSLLTEKPLLAGVARMTVWVLAAWFVLRFGDLALRGALPLAFAGDLRGNMFLVETALFAVPFVVLVSARRRDNGALLVIAAVCMLLAGAVYRFNAFLIGFDPSPGYVYFPSVPEIMVSVGIVAFEILLYLIIVKTFPVLHATERAPARAN